MPGAHKSSEGAARPNLAGSTLSRRLSSTSQGLRDWMEEDVRRTNYEKPTFEHGTTVGPWAERYIAYAANRKLGHDFKN